MLKVSDNNSKQILWLFLCTVILTISCNSLPPTEVSVNEKPFFDPRNLEWQAAESPSLMASTWYYDGSLYLWTSGDTLRLAQYLSVNWQVESADAYYRLVYEYCGEYYAIYIEPQSSDTLNYKMCDRAAASRDEIDLIPATANWQQLTSFIPWRRQTAGLPPLLQGNWLQQNGELELQIDAQQVMINGDFWALDSVQTNDHAEYRMVISSGDSSLAVYYHIDSEFSVRLLFWSLAEDIQNKNGYIQGPWMDYQRIYECLDLLGWHEGASLTYNYNLTLKDATISERATPRDSQYVSYEVSGTMQLTFSGANITNGQGSMDVTVSFAVDSYKARKKLTRLYLDQDNEPASEVIDDSLFTEAGTFAERVYTLSMVNDTLWLDQPGGLVYFCVRQVGVFSTINLLPFVYPLDPPKANFPADNWLDASIILDDRQPPRWISPLEGSGGQVISGPYGELTYGKVEYSWVEIKPAGNMYRIEFHEGAMDRRWWLIDDSYDSDPFYHSSSFSCTLQP